MSESKDVVKHLEETNNELTQEVANLRYALNAVVKKGKLMRERQDLFFKSKNNVDLRASKALEKDFDDYVKLLVKRGFGEELNDAKQKPMF